MVGFAHKTFLNTINLLRATVPSVRMQTTSLTDFAYTFLQMIAVFPRQGRKVALHNIETGLASFSRTGTRALEPEPIQGESTKSSNYFPCMKKN